jgi:hypothetical protein
MDHQASQPQATRGEAEAKIGFNGNDTQQTPSIDKPEEAKGTGRIHEAQGGSPVPESYIDNPEYGTDREDHESPDEEYFSEKACLARIKEIPPDILMDAYSWSVKNRVLSRRRRVALFEVANDLKNRMEPSLRKARRAYLAYINAKWRGYDEKQHKK